MPDLQAQLRLLLVSHNALILAFGAVNASQKAAWRNSANAQKALICFSVIRAFRAVVPGCFLTKAGVSWAKLDGESNGRSKDRIKTSAFVCHRRVGLLTEIRTSFTRSDSSGEIVLVRFHRLRARWQSAGRRENFAEALSRDVRRDCSRRR